MRRAFAAIAVMAVCTAPAAAQSQIYVVRHAERADAGLPKSQPDPDLSDIGHARATSLAATLKESGITAIFVTPLKRTQQTAAPLAKALGLTPTVIEANDLTGLSEKLKAHRGAALVVGHSNTLPEILERLGIRDPVAVGDTEFDQLFIVIRARADDPTLLKLRYR